MLAAQTRSGAIAATTHPFSYLEKEHICRLLLIFGSWLCLGAVSPRTQVCFAPNKAPERSNQVVVSLTSCHKVVWTLLQVLKARLNPPRVGGCPHPAKAIFQQLAVSSQGMDAGGVLQEVRSVAVPGGSWRTDLPRQSCCKGKHHSSAPVPCGRWRGFILLSIVLGCVECTWNVNPLQ